MNIVFYKNSSEKIVVDKTTFLSSPITISCTLKSGCNILNPTLLVNYSVSNITSYNYCYIEEFNRYYFVENVEYGINNLILVYLKIDVLMTYKTGLLSLNAYVARNEFTFNRLLEDKIIDFNYDKEILFDDSIFTYYFDFTPNLNIFDNDNKFTKNVIVNSISNEITYAGSPGSSLAIQEEYKTLPAINDLTTGDFTNSYIYVISWGNLLRLSNYCLNDDTLETYIKSVIILPFEIKPWMYFRKANGGEITDVEQQIVKSKTLYIGKRLDVDVSINNDDYIWSSFNLGSFARIKYCTFNVPQATSFLDFYPYTIYELYIPYVGYIDINFEEMKGCSITIFFNINVENAEALCIIYNDTKEYVIKQLKCNLGISFSLSSTNNREVNNQRNNLMISAAINTITSSLNIASGLALNSPVAFNIGATQVGKTISNTITGFNNIYDKGNTNISSGNSGLLLPQKCYIKKTKVIPTNFSTDEQIVEFRKLYGKPLNENRVLNTLTGFTIIKEIHIEGSSFDGATSRELEELETLVKNGIIL